MCKQNKLKLPPAPASIKVSALGRPLPEPDKVGITLEVDLVSKARLTNLKICHSERSEESLSQNQNNFIAGEIASPQTLPRLIGGEHLFLCANKETKSPPVPASIKVSALGGFVQPELGKVGITHNVDLVNNAIRTDSKICHSERSEESLLQNPTNFM